jgi:uncharacterized repeat protein (TIGR03803 family)
MNQALQSMVAALLAASMAGPATAATFKVLHHFNPAHGGAPKGGLAIDAQGTLYGTTSTGGANGVGTVFKFAGGRLTTIHDFSGGADGATPLGRLLLDSHGNLYGTTYAGGPADAGTVFKVKAGLHYRQLAALDGSTQGSNVNGGVAQGTDGTLYGAAVNGGASNAGTLLAFRPPAYAPSVIYSFSGWPSDQGYPESEPIIDAGRLKGTGEDTIYSILPDGSGLVNYADPANFDQEPIYAGLTPDGQGNLWGVMRSEYNQNLGELYRIDANGTLTYEFDFTSDEELYGTSPRGTLVRGANGVLYGTTLSGGRTPGGTLGDGTVFSYDPASGTFTTLYVFAGDDSKGGQLYAGLVQDAAGRLYGVTSVGGKFGGGTLFRIDP